MSKKTETKKEQKTEEKRILVELVQEDTTPLPWIIYNLARKNLLNQYEQEQKDYLIKEIKPTITLTDYEKIINGEK